MKRNRINLSSVILAISVLFLVACKKDNPTPQSSSRGGGGSSYPNDYTNSVLVINEGNFNQGNASISYYNPSDNKTLENVFATENGNVPLGDVAQSIAAYNGKGYIVVNNSSKIEIVNLVTMKSEGTISGFVSPRYMVFENANKAYVSDLFSNSVAIVDPQNQSITGYIPISGWTENMVLYNNQLFVANQTKNQIIIVNTLTNNVVDSIQLTDGLNSLLIDQNNMLWALCSGDAWPNTGQGMLYKIDPATKATTLYAFGATDSPSLLRTNGTGSLLYYALNGAVYEMSVNASVLPTNALINTGSYYYGMNIDPVNNEIYLADAVDFVQKGYGFRYAATGNLIQQFNAQYIPNGFFFNY